LELTKQILTVSAVEGTELEVAERFANTFPLGPQLANIFIAAGLTARDI
jgi:hypothetical protein